MSQCNARGSGPEDRKTGYEAVVSSAREEATRLSNRSISDRGRELAQYIQELYDSGAKLWTKDMFRDIEAELAKEPKPDAIMIRSMNGTLRRKQVPIEGPDPLLGIQEYLYVFLRFNIYQELIFDAEEETTELDQDEDVEPYDSEINDEDDKSFLTCALTLGTTAEIPSTIDYLQLKAAWNEAERNWNMSTVCSEIKEILGKRISIPTTAKNIVCFGLGSLEEWPPHSRLNELATCDGLPLRRTMTQHLAALTIAVTLGKRLGTEPLPVIAQDPAYSLVAKQLLMSLGIKVVDGRGSLAFTEIDEDSVVLSCSPNIPVKQIVADIARPAIMIWDKVQPAEEERAEWTVTMIKGEEALCSPWSTDQDSPRTRKMIEEYSQYDFPEEQERFCDLKIYVRKA